MSEIVRQLRKELALATKKKQVSIEELEASEQVVQGWKDRPRIQDDPEVRAVESEFPGFIFYLTGLQNVVLFGGMIRKHPLLRELDECITKAQVLYEEGAAAEVITGSFFNSWEFFDAYFGDKEGTFGSLYLEFADEFGIPNELAEVIGRCCTSRLGIYHHLGKRGEFIELQDLATGEKLKAINPRGYLGRKGEIWLVRFYAAAWKDAALAMTTPYVIRSSSPEQWKAFFIANGVKQPSNVAAVMKFPKDPFFWFEYIVNSAERGGLEGDHIVLKGMPQSSALT